MWQEIVFCKVGIWLWIFRKNETKSDERYGLGGKNLSHYVKEDEEHRETDEVFVKTSIKHAKHFVVPVNVLYEVVHVWHTLQTPVRNRVSSINPGVAIKSVRCNVLNNE